MVIVTLHGKAGKVLDFVNLMASYRGEKMLADLAIGDMVESDLKDRQRELANETARGRSETNDG